MSSDFAWNQEQGVWKIFEPILPSAAECKEEEGEEKNLKIQGGF